LESPMVILVGGVSYVPITPLVTAFEGESGWDPDALLVSIETVDLLGHVLPAPRIGVSGGVTRVALDLPEGATYQLAAGGPYFVIIGPNARADAMSLPVSDDNVSTVHVASQAGRVNLTVSTLFDLDPAGRGYTVGSVPTANGTTLYVDFARDSSGDAVTAMGQPEAPGPQALAQAPEGTQIVVIDAGHGGHDPGTSSRYAIEEHLVLNVALLLKQRLEAEGLEVILTRDHDTFLELRERSAFATTERNIFVSIHANSAPSNKAEGIETWVFGEPLDPSYIDQAIRENGGGALGEERTAEARQIANQLAADILREAQFNLSLALADSVQSRLVSATGARDQIGRAHV